MAGRRPRKEHLPIHFAQAKRPMGSGPTPIDDDTHAPGRSIRRRTFNRNAHDLLCVIPTRVRRLESVEAPEEEVRLRQTRESENQDPEPVARRRSRQQPPVAVPLQSHPMLLGTPRHKTHFGNLNCFHCGDDASGHGRRERRHTPHSPRPTRHK